MDILWLMTMITIVVNGLTGLPDWYGNVMRLLNAFILCCMSVWIINLGLNKLKKMNILLK